MKSQTKQTIALAAVMLGAAMILFAPSAIANSGCVYSGGGWICAGEQPPSEPGELPVVDPTPEPEPSETIIAVIETPTPPPAPVVETAPPAPPAQSVCD